MLNNGRQKKSTPFPSQSFQVLVTCHRGDAPFVSLSLYFKRCLSLPFTIYSLSLSLLGFCYWGALKKGSALSYQLCLKTHESSSNVICKCSHSGCHINRFKDGFYLNSFRVLLSKVHMSATDPANPYPNAPMVASGNPSVAVPSPNQPPSPFSNSPHQLAYQQAQYFHQQQQQQQLQMFWANQMQEIEQTTDFKNHSLPLARIKKIMKADEDVRMISAEAPVIFAKACEMFILELTLRSWIHTEENKRRTLQKNDIAAAISRTDVFDFLVDIIPRDELKEEGLGVTKSAIPVVGSPPDIPYYYVPPHPVGPPGMIMGKPVIDEAAMYGAQQPRPPMAFMPWPHSQPQSEQNQE